MYFRSEKHRELFKDATKKMDKKDNVSFGTANGNGVSLWQAPSKA